MSDGIKFIARINRENNECGLVQSLAILKQSYNSSLSPNEQLFYKEFLQELKAYMPNLDTDLRDAGLL